jgi:hypothetical protein
MSVLTLKEQKELRKKEKALAEAAALLLVTEKMQALWGEAEEGRTGRCAD